MRRRLWVWPIIAVTMLLVLGWGVHGSIENTMRENLRSQLQTLNDVEVDMLRTWLAAHENNAKSVASDSDVRQLVEALLDADSSVERKEDISAQLARQLRPALSSHDYESFFIGNKQEILASARPDAVGLQVPFEFREMINRVFESHTTVMPPFASILPDIDDQGKRRTGVPVMFVIAPILDSHLQVVATLGLHIRPEKEFTRILQLGRLGDSGETYAFDQQGLMLSNSRFDDDLILLGILPDQPGSRSILNLHVRDPGGDMTKGFRPKVRRAELPFTTMATSAIAGEQSTDVDGYNDYRGVTVTGAWTWLPEYHFGVATEIDFAEAYRPLIILKRTFWVLLSLLAASSLAIFMFTVRVARLQEKAREAAIEAKQLGQYQLEEQLGEGAMGVVYRGRHAMLRRPTAIKLLNADRVNDTSIESFEREVQITSNLNHPNTIAIYDYGHTPEGVFYYAMEYLDGIDLQQLVDAYGPQPSGRVIFILEQVCGSLYEAHSTGLVHRDIKPANIMVNRRGGEGDVVKVLDFGLVKARSEQIGENGSESMAGTPLYMSPESIQLPNSVDACSDIYAVGAVGYFLLTGTPVFEADNLTKLCQLHISEPPQPPSQRLGKPVDPELENAILKCLEKDRSKRPQTSRDLATLLGKCASAHEWTLDKADAWWGQHERGQLASLASTAASSSAYEATIDHS
ncbi:MAG: serine/threonine protein kinase [Planctomycetota bacterium]